jgi:hypothetical protein
MRSLALLLLLTADVSAQTITIAPATVDRAALVVNVKVPRNPGAALSVKDEAGREYPLQAEDDASSTCIIGFLTANTGLTLKVTKHAAPQTPTVKVGPGEDGLTLTIDGKPALNFRTDKAKKPRDDIKDEILRAGYLHPVSSPSGAIVTGDYPSNHAHHHGIWTPYTKAVFQGRTTDFWNMQSKKGEEQLRAVGRLWAGEVHGGFREPLMA